MVIDDLFSDVDVAIVDDRKFGGTCVNYGCIPSKMLSYTAQIADTVACARSEYSAAAFDAEISPRR